MTTKTTPKPDEKPAPTPPEDAPKGVPGEDDRAARMAPAGPDAVKVAKGTVTL
jgi:hypothetical protein